MICYRILHVSDTWQLKVKFQWIINKAELDKVSLSLSDWISDSESLINKFSSKSALQLALSNFCNRHFHNLNAYLILVFNPLILSGSNEYVWMSDLKLETVIEIAKILISLLQVLERE
jgi:hypothetical protein